MLLNLDSLVKSEVPITITTSLKVKLKVEVMSLPKVMSHHPIWKLMEQVSINILTMSVTPVSMNGKSFQIFNQKISKHPETLK